MFQGLKNIFNNTKHFVETEIYPLTEIIIHNLDMLFDHNHVIIDMNYVPGPVWRFNPEALNNV